MFGLFDDDNDKPNSRAEYIEHHLGEKKRSSLMSGLKKGLLWSGLVVGGLALAALAFGFTNPITAIGGTLLANAFGISVGNTALWTALGAGTLITGFMTAQSYLGHEEKQEDLTEELGQEYDRRQRMAQMKHMQDMQMQMRMAQQQKQMALMSGQGGIGAPQAGIPMQPPGNGQSGPASGV